MLHAEPALYPSPRATMELKLPLPITRISQNLISRNQWVIHSETDCRLRS